MTEEEEELALELEELELKARRLAEADNKPPPPPPLPWAELEELQREADHIRYEPEDPFAPVYAAATDLEARVDELEARVKRLEALHVCFKCKGESSTHCGWCVGSS